MLLFLTDRLTEECVNELNTRKAHLRGCRGSLRDSRFQTAAWGRQCLAQVHGSLILNPIARQIDDVQGRIFPQHLGQIKSTIATHAVTAELQYKTIYKGEILSDKLQP